MYAPVYIVQMGRTMFEYIFFVSAIIFNVNADPEIIVKELDVRKDLEFVLIDSLNRLVERDDVKCITVICDPVYLNIFEGNFFRRPLNVSFVMIVVEEYEDLLSPNFDTLETLRLAKNDGCNVYVIILANGLQVSRLLRFGDRKVIGNAKSKAWFELSTVPFPNPIEGIFISRRVDIWRNGKFHYSKNIFADKTGNLNGEVLNVVYIDHIPSVIITKSNETKKVGGVEIEILNTLAQKMKFKPRLYQPKYADAHKWGQKQANGSFNGLLGEMVQGKADLALGNLQYTPYHLELTDLSIPYTSQCWTFLTPEALTDNSWKTLILPFKLYMWIAVLLVLLVTGSIFYALAFNSEKLLKYSHASTCHTAKNNIGAKPVGLYLFGEITNSILYTYGMLLVVSLPKLPSGWSIRLLTGWYWLYCILLVVSYRASMTAILANPAPRVTIDTLKELVESRIACGGWGGETKKFFKQSLDDIGQKIGERFENVNNPADAAGRIVQGLFAYYDSANYLKYLRVKRKNTSGLEIEIDNSTSNNTNALTNKAERDLHIMSDCVVHIPISIGFHKNSPLKPLADTYIKRIVEVGLVEKWLNDVMYKIRSLDTSEEEVKALINLKKLYCAFIALAIGYTLSSICLFGEFIHWQLVVKKDPNFDKYAVDVYYMNKNM